MAASTVSGSSLTGKGDSRSVANAVLPASGGGAAATVKRMDVFNSSGTWTAPADVTYAVAHIYAGGGGGGGYTGLGSSGGSSSAFGTTALGGRGGQGARYAYQSDSPGDAPANSGNGGVGDNALYSPGTSTQGADGTYLVVGSSVTPGTGYTITVGAGGAASNYFGNRGGNGGSGQVLIEYEVAV